VGPSAVQQVDKHFKGEAPVVRYIRCNAASPCYLASFMSLRTQVAEHSLLLLKACYKQDERTHGFFWRSVFPYMVTSVHPLSVSELSSCVPASQQNKIGVSRLLNPVSIQRKLSFLPSL
jgi:hypothetical protein